MAPGQETPGQMVYSSHTAQQQIYGAGTNVMTSPGSNIAQGMNVRGYPTSENRIFSQGSDGGFSMYPQS